MALCIDAASVLRLGGKNVADRYPVWPAGAKPYPRWRIQDLWQIARAA
ncbi:hypothetical protein [Antarcticirhabdus aurantiaca]|uniref:Uncharacterized protein n=1 Tax=Antarcticirhabdus aurantiaca TaxID=2606717 RepID=A0ACD4NH89_9HYPH|nr:hypothetical protein [Antarcticirhabdus aurantiaca]WAJ26178.1 hypothetical protein OXU80_14785 [Jeongeuplla avenae]